MSDAQWTREDVHGFVTKVSAFYTDLNETQQQIFTDMLRAGVWSAADVSGYALSEQPVSATTMSAALSEYLMAHPAAIP